jgi:hypothetical protein
VAFSDEVKVSERRFQTRLVVEQPHIRAAGRNTAGLTHSTCVAGFSSF